MVQRAPVSYGGGMYPGFILDFVGVCSESACEVWSFGRVRRIYAPDRPVGGRQKRQIDSFAEEVCETLDEAIAGRQPKNFQPYEDSLTAKVQSKLMQYYDIMREERTQSQQDKEILQGLSAISRIRSKLP